MMYYSFAEKYKLSRVKEFDNMNFKTLLKLYLLRAGATIGSFIAIMLGVMGCSAMAGSKSGVVQGIGLLIGAIGLVGGIALFGVAVAARHLLFKDAYNERSYSHSDVDITYRRKRGWW
jgi:hypothetical protein